MAGRQEVFAEVERLRRAKGRLVAAAEEHLRRPERPVARSPCDVASRAGPGLAGQAPALPGPGARCRGSEAAARCATEKTSVRRPRPPGPRARTRQKAGQAAAARLTNHPPSSRWQSRRAAEWSPLSRFLRGHPAFHSGFFEERTRATSPRECDVPASTQRPGDTQHSRDRTAPGDTPHPRDHATPRRHATSPQPHSTRRHPTSPQRPDDTPSPRPHSTSNHAAFP